MKLQLTLDREVGITKSNRLVGVNKTKREYNHNNAYSFTNLNENDLEGGLVTVFIIVRSDGRTLERASGNKTISLLIR